MARADKSKGPSTAQRVRDHLDRQPLLRTYLRKGIVNHAALARQLAPTLGIKSEEAVEVATRRYEQQLDNSDDEALAVSKLLARSRLEMRTKVASVTATNDWIVMARLEKVMKGMLSRRAFLQVIQGIDSITIITDEDHYDSIIETIGKETIIATRRELAEILVKSPPIIADTPGVVAHVAAILSLNGINVVEMVSCHTDMIFIVDLKQIMEGYHLLQKSIDDATIDLRSAEAAVE